MRRPLFFAHQARGLCLYSDIRYLLSTIKNTLDIVLNSKYKTHSQVYRQASWRSFYHTAMWAGRRHSAQGKSWGQ